MNEEKWLEIEYNGLRDELTRRVILLHKSINLGVISLMVLTIGAFILIGLGVSLEILETYLLIIPLILYMIGFNYQSNQNSLESIPKYFDEVLKPILKEKYGPNVLGWEKFFAVQKEPFKVESTTKVLAFIAPSVIPLYYIFSGTILSNYQWALVVTDIFFLLILLENFRYKLRRVKCP